MVAYKCESLASVRPIEDISGKQAKSLNPVSTYQYISSYIRTTSTGQQECRNFMSVRENIVRNHDGQAKKKVATEISK